MKYAILLFFAVWGCEAQELSIQNMHALLKSHTAGYVPWRIADFVNSQPLQNENILRPLLVKDLNSDGREDLIFDGLLNGENKLLALLSEAGSYKAIYSDSWHSVTQPSQNKVVEEGRLLFGLNYLVWVNDAFSNKEEPVLSIGYPQQTDVSGDIVADGEVLSVYLSKNGELFFEGETL
ncbi:hypothetical protein [Vibrio nigripulchritudo]|uniref:hypothetical protein n=1 Tax=Vibrio nigripulchritudo TaxID=28173 RepID=UPI0003B21939|nr:hypothetical protein [Vibrio nigripulchritudo]CCN69136.1 hypothetical protein VIBNISFn118_120078 [Vibrio nigripulchritudo SFn118]